LAALCRLPDLGDLARHLPGEDFQERARIQTAGTQLTESLAHAQKVTQLTEAVGRELLLASTNSPEAAQIVAQFKIKLNQSPRASR
jgi:hypothetical protein